MVTLADVTPPRSRRVREGESIVADARRAAGCVSWSVVAGRRVLRASREASGRATSAATSSHGPRWSNAPRVGHWSFPDLLVCEARQALCHGDYRLTRSNGVG